MPRTPHASVKLKHRITSLERWGMRESADFQSQSVACIQEAGFNGVLVNGGSGIGPDMMTPESLVHSDVIPDLMPRTIKGNQREMNRRCELLTEVDIKPWICMWGVPGADTSSGTAAAESNRLFSRLTRHEIQAKFDRTPDIFGQRGAGGLSWRGSRPLCISHPTVQAYYRDLIQQLIKTYCLQGIFYFPGDHQPETCDDNCPRCKATGKDSWQRMLEYVNMLYEAAIGVNPDFKMYFTFWNVRDTDPERARIKQMISQLHPGLGICMSLSDVGYDERPGGQMQFDQPWVIRAQPGELFVTTAKLAHEQQRPIMAMGEISQAELWDPVCHNMPNPQKVLQWLTHANQVPGIDAICDFWGHRRPYHSHANHRAMHAWLDDPTASHDVLLQRSIAAHYGLPDDKPQLLEQAIACQKAFDKTVDEWALLAWSQRFSYAIGRDAARGRLYTALIPHTFKKIDAGFWDQRFKVQCEAEESYFSKNKILEPSEISDGNKF